MALKVIAPDVAGKPVFRTRFERECRAPAAIDQPHVVRIYNAGQDEGLLYLTVRYVDGSDLRRCSGMRAGSKHPEPSRSSARSRELGQAAIEQREHVGRDLLHGAVGPERQVRARWHLVERVPAPLLADDDREAGVRDSIAIALAISGALPQDGAGSPTFDEHDAAGMRRARS